jgi:hypothetical protein
VPSSYLHFNFRPQLACPGGISEIAVNAALNADLAGSDLEMIGAVVGFVAELEHQLTQACGLL